MKRIKYSNHDFKTCTSGLEQSATCIESSSKLAAAGDDNSSQIDPKIEETIDFIYSYAPGIVEWKTLKRELLKSISPARRRLFSKKDTITNKMNFNDFEKAIIEYWQKLTGTKIYLNES